mmetsp:Transcript_9370/g.25880  ORF Transcript_9370/g.25880 Transcript_9370/m.25880 type:complete len:946 (-) Transcript_9370:130-2967(-)
MIRLNANLQKPCHTIVRYAARICNNARNAPRIALASKRVVESRRNAIIELHQLSFCSTASNGDRSSPNADPSAKDIPSLELQIESEITRLRLQDNRGNPQQGETPPEVVDRIVELYNQWWSAHRSPTTTPSNQNQPPQLTRRPEDNKVFRAVLEACSVYDPRGSQSVTIMDNWGEALGKVFEFGPQREDFDQLLLAYASQKFPGEGNPAGEAIDVIDLLEEWSFTMKPVVRTYLLAIRCISQGILAQLSATEKETTSTKLKEFTTYLRGLLEKVDPLLSQEMDTNHVVLSFQSCGEAVCALISVRDELSNEERQDVISSAENFSNHWLRLFETTALRENCNIGCEDVVAETAQAILNLYELAAPPRECADLSFSLIQKMEEMNSDMLPSNAHYFQLIKAWNSLPGLEGNDAYDLRSLVQGLNRRHFSRIHLFEPEKASLEFDFLMKSYMQVKQFALVCEVWENMAEHSTIKRSEQSTLLYFESLLGIGTPDAIQKADDVLRGIALSPEAKHLLLPNHFEMLLYSWARSRHQDYLARCNNLFQLMKQLSESNTRLIPTQEHYSAIIEAWGLDAKQNKRKNAPRHISKIINEMNEKNLRPNAASYMALLKALSCTDSPGAAPGAEKILELLEKEYPTDVTSDGYASAISVWSKSGHSQAVERCKSILARNHAIFENSDLRASLRPTCEAYRGVIGAIANSKSPEAAVLAERVLDDMERHSAGGFCDPPDEYTYTSVMNIYAKLNHSHEAVGRILQRMESAYSNGQATARPNTSSYNSFLNSIVRSNAEDKAWMANRIYQSMRARFQKGDLSVRPDPYTTTAVLTSCASTVGVDEKAREELVGIALSVLLDCKGQVDRRGRPMLDSRNYAMVLRIIHQDVLDPSEGERLAAQVFEQCCHEGMIDKSVLYQIKEGFKGLHRQLPRDAKGQLKLPRGWTQHAKRPQRKKQ